MICKQIQKILKIAEKNNENQFLSFILILTIGKGLDDIRQGFKPNGGSL